MLYMALGRPKIYMNVKDLRDGMRSVDVEGEISEMGEPRTVNLKNGDEARVADCKLRDESGEVRLSLWGEQIDRVKVGSKVRIEKGYTSTFRSELGLNVGRYGKLDVLES